MRVKWVDQERMKRPLNGSLCVDLPFLLDIPYQSDVTMVTLIHYRSD